jgi:hypothetical protein
MAAMFRHVPVSVIGVFIYPFVDNRGVDGPPLIGRDRELAALADALERLRGGAAGALAVEGEPGIGKSRLLAELADRAVRDGCHVAGARASEAELDLPYAAFTEALVPFLGQQRLDRLGLEDPGALAAFLEPLAALAAPEIADRHRVHRALRDLLGALAATTPLVVWLDDVHWLDPASADALAALMRRLPSTRVLLAVATREGQAPRPVAAAIAAALRDGTLHRIAPRPLDEAEGTALVGSAAATIYADSGGNPFYSNSSPAPTARPTPSTSKVCPIASPARWHPSSTPSPIPRACCSRRPRSSATRSTRSSPPRWPTRWRRRRRSTNSRSAH